jgi:hypothetical protein
MNPYTPTGISQICKGSKIKTIANNDYSTTSYMRAVASLNDSIYSAGENDFFSNTYPPVLPEPKRTASNSNIEKKMMYKSKNSLFMSLMDKDEKGDEFANLAELMSTINCSLWEYAKLQKGSRSVSM